MSLWQEPPSAPRNAGGHPPNHPTHRYILLAAATDILNLLIAWAAGVVLVGGWGLGACWALGLVGLTRKEEAASEPEAIPPLPTPRGRRAGATAAAAPGRGRGRGVVVPPGGIGVAGWWLGLPVLLVFLQAWQLLLPVGTLALSAAGVVALAGLALGRTALLRWGRSLVAHPVRSLAVLGAVGLLSMGVVGVSARGGASAEVAVAWEPLLQLARQWALPPGVGNLSAPLGLNHAGSLLAALLSAGPLPAAPGRAVAGLVALPVLAAAVAGLARLVAGTGKDAEDRGGAAAAAFDAGGGLLLAAWLLGPGLHAPLPGVLAGGMLFAACGQALRGGSVGFVPHRGERIDRLTAALLLAVAAAWAHPPAAVAALTLAAWLGWLLLATERATLPARRSTRSVGIDHDRLPGAAARQRTVIVGGVVLAAGSVLWLVRASIATGRPLFPFHKAPLPVGWIVADNAAKKLHGLLGNPPPLGRLIEQGAPVLLPALVGVVLWLVWLARGGAEGRQRRLAPLPLVLAAGLSAGLFLPGAGSALAVNAALAAAVWAAGLAVLVAGSGTGPGATGGAAVGRKAADASRGHDRRWLPAAATLAACAFVVAGMLLVPTFLDEEPVAEPAAAAAMAPWRSTWNAEAAVPAGDRSAAAAAGLPGLTPLPAAAKEPPEALRERWPGHPDHGYVIDFRDPRQVAW